jgi:hypothetical protein
MSIVIFNFSDKEPGYAQAFAAELEKLGVEASSGASSIYITDAASLERYNSMLSEDPGFLGRIGKTSTLNASAFVPPPLPPIEGQDVTLANQQSSDTPLAPIAEVEPYKLSSPASNPAAIRLSFMSPATTDEEIHNSMERKGFSREDYTIGKPRRASDGQFVRDANLSNANASGRAISWANENLPAHNRQSSLEGRPAHHDCGSESAAIAAQDRDALNGIVSRRNGQYLYYDAANAAKYQEVYIKPHLEGGMNVDSNPNKPFTITYRSPDGNPQTAIDDAARSAQKLTDRGIECRVDGSRVIIDKPDAIAKYNNFIDSMENGGMNVDTPANRPRGNSGYVDAARVIDQTLENGQSSFSGQAASQGNAVAGAIQAVGSTAKGDYAGAAAGLAQTGAGLAADRFAMAGNAGMAAKANIAAGVLATGYAGYAAYQETGDMDKALAAAGKTGASTAAIMGGMAVAPAVVGTTTTFVAGTLGSAATAAASATTTAAAAAAAAASATATATTASAAAAAASATAAAASATAAAASATTAAAAGAAATGTAAAAATATAVGLAGAASSVVAAGVGGYMVGDAVMEKSGAKAAIDSSITGASNVANSLMANPGRGTDLVKYEHLNNVGTDLHNRKAQQIPSYDEGNGVLTPVELKEHIATQRQEAMAMKGGGVKGWLQEKLVGKDLTDRGQALARLDAAEQELKVYEKEYGKLAAPDSSIKNELTQATPEKAQEQAKQVGLNGKIIASAEVAKPQSIAEIAKADTVRSSGEVLRA